MPCYPHIADSTHRLTFIYIHHTYNTMIMLTTHHVHSCTLEHIQYYTVLPHQMPHTSSVIFIHLYKLKKVIWWLLINDKGICTPQKTYTQPFIHLMSDQQDISKTTNRLEERPWYQQNISRRLHRALSPLNRSLKIHKEMLAMKEEIKDTYWGAGWWLWR